MVKMTPQPKGHHGQSQCLTTALKNICRDYPAGGGVLRELLQNADDAGATEVRFVLDESTHPVEELLDTKLEQYQGPALLAYNNAIFRDEDFQSLSRLGDSLKFNDGSTTGKFGRGFNSVYNWTDSPSIVSRERLLILDPHYEWTESAGPWFDFVENFEDLAIQNHMSAFKAIMEHLERPLDGTVIRIPLRNQARASISEICNRETTVAELSEVLESFAVEFGKTGLLFMRNIEKFEIKYSDKSFTIEMSDLDSLRRHKSKVNNAVKEAFVNPGYSFEYSFEVAMEYKANRESKKTMFLLHHSIECGLMDVTLRAWAKSQKYIPWVAVAAQLPVQASGMGNGSLFTVLPLPITTNQPVHIHGLFSISPDRARLYQLDDKSAQDRDPGLWNKFLFQKLVPAAWTKLLCCLAEFDPGRPSFEKWPQPPNDTRDPLNNALENVVAIIEKGSLPLWHTGVGYKNAANSLIGRGVESVPLRNALQEAGAPVVFVPEQLRHRSQNLFKGRILSPQSLCSFLRSVNNQIKSWSHQTKHEILEYLLAEPGFTGYGGLDLFLFEDGTYRSVGETNTFVHRDPLEEDLFSLEGVCNLVIRNFSASAQQALKRGCQNSNNHSGIRYRSARDLREYCMSFVFKNVAEDKDFVILNERAATAAAKIRTWILDRGFCIEDQDISWLWLLPVSNGYHRRIKPEEASSQVYFAPSGETGDLMRRLDAHMTSKPLPLLDMGPLGLASIDCRSQFMMSNLLIQDATRIVPLLLYMKRIWALVEDITEEDRLLISQAVASYSPQELSSTELEAVIEVLRHIPIFQKVSWKAAENRMEHFLSWTNLNCCNKTFGLLDGINPVPEIDDIQFVSASLESPSNKLFRNFALGECLDSKGLLQNVIVPAWENKKDRHWSTSCKEHLAEFVLGQFSLLSLDVQERLRRIPLVPVSQLNGEETTRFALAEELIDPTVPELKGLCFDDEEIVPKQSFLRRFNAALKGCGLKTAVDESVANHRIHCYASDKYPLQEVEKRAQRLLKAPCHWTTPLENQGDAKLSCLQWLPVTDHSGTFILKASDECRGTRDRLLVNSQLPILNTPILSEWERRLGWDKLLPRAILLSQLECGIVRKDREVVDAVLTYISQRDLTKTLAGSLMGLSCVLVSSGMFVEPSNAFRPPTGTNVSCEGLQPYLANVENKFWQDHEEVLKQLNVGDQLQLSDLLKVQSILESKSVLGESDVDVAIQVAISAGKLRLPRASLAGLKVLSEDGRLYSIQDINYDDLWPLTSKEKVTLTHPNIPKSTIDSLNVEGLRARLLKGMLDIEDVDDEDEFDQREKVTTRIADTLDRYPVETTFREYLANADDSEGASHISWLLDQRVHLTGTLMTPELKVLQGPALLVHNDGVFSQDDFEGFKNVGVGSKAHDKATIGQFGRGSQTMYHWTDVPMILSGGVLVILDPQQEVLPWNTKKGKRKSGVRLDLSKLREACGDQLVPFEGLWDFTQALDYYPGTIFRFPFRPAANCTESALRKNKKVLNEIEAHRLLESYFDEARVSLLFLRRIKSIDFSVHGDPDSGWSVTRLESVDEDDDLFSKSVICQYTMKTLSGTPIRGKDKWWVAIEDLTPEVDQTPEISRRALKNVECGMAALISSTPDSQNPKATVPKVIQSRMFSTLPLPISSDLPVHFHATFLLSGDRQSLAIDEQGIHTQEAKWNRHLLQEHLPNLYLSFLENIGPQVRQRVFSFWPQEEPPKRSSAELLCCSFWQKLPQSSQRLFPKAHPVLGQRRPPEQLDITQAVFDFLPQKQSEALATLLMAMQVNLVHKIPKEVSRRLKIVPGTKSITGPMLRALFKSEQGKTFLLRVIANDVNHEHILEVLFNLMIPTVGNEQLSDLDGCHILPLHDGTLATLEYDDTKKVRTLQYFVVSEDELKLFGFASSRLVKSSVKLMLEPVLGSGKFNLARLKLDDVKKLLELKPAVAAPNENEDKWLEEFWKYWNGNVESSLPESKIDDLGANIFRAVLDAAPIYASPAKFQSLPAVVEPLMGDHRKLCDSFPDLWRFDVRFMSKSLRHNEISFNNGASFDRFIRSLRMLSGQNGIGSYVKSHLSVDDLKILQALVISHVSNGILTREVEPFPDLENDLKSIPLWPVFQPSFPNQLISAADALMSVNDRLLVPWMKDSSRFVLPSFLGESPRNRDCLTKLGVKELAIEALFRDYVLPMPSTLSVVYWQYYEPLIPIISGISYDSHSWDTLFPTLTDTAIAADGNCNLKKACQLYDHEDRIFASAFRHQAKTRFLHPSIQKSRWFWTRVGLRQLKDHINAADYIQCLQVLRLRLSAEDTQNDQDLERDLQTVLSPLIDRSFSTRSFSDRDWQAISRERVFRSRTDFGAEPEYRRDAMAALSVVAALPLSGIVLHEYVALCWSQSPFVVHEPTREVLGHIAGHGHPDMDTVWRHLQYMKIISEGLKRDQIQDFLSELNSIYQYLQEHLVDSSAGFALGNGAVWLNLHTSDYSKVQLEDIKASWKGIEDLVLSNSYDAGLTNAVRSGLRRFEMLLRGLGCRSFSYPTMTRPTLHIDRSVSRSLQQLRKEEKLLDITFSTEGKLIKAHKLVLAAMSEKCAVQFNPRWPQEVFRKYDENTDPDDYLSYHTLSTMISYAYDEDIDWKAMEVLDDDDEDTRATKLDLLLDLHMGADSWLIPTLKSQVEDKLLVAREAFVNWSNVVEIRARAEMVRATEFERWCAELIRENQHIVGNAPSGNQ